MDDQIIRTNNNTDVKIVCDGVDFLLNAAELGNVTWYRKVSSADKETQIAHWYRGNTELSKVKVHVQHSKKAANHRLYFYCLVAKIPSMLPGSVLRSVNKNTFF